MKINEIILQIQGILYYLLDPDMIIIGIMGHPVDAHSRGSRRNMGINHYFSEATCIRTY